MESANNIAMFTSSDYLSPSRITVDSESANRTVDSEKSERDVLDENAPSEHVYQIPQKLVKNMKDMAAWDKSEAYYDLMGFINSVSLTIQGKKISEADNVSPAVMKLLDILQKLEDLARETPPIDQPQRFGNSAFRCWYQKMKDVTLDMVQDLLPESLVRAAPELEPYLSESFGNSTRIDYGTGHELSFVMFLICLFKLDVFVKSDEMAVGLKVFDKYIRFARKLQVTYRMEPAGSQGVWSLDDYQFIPFIWGSAQLINSPVEPPQFLDEEIINKYKKEYIFLGCIDYIKQVKTGHFAEHSNQLWSISAVPSWSKINSGLVKMYQKELMPKFPVIQHVLFGSLLTLRPVRRGITFVPSRLGMRPPPDPLPKSVDIPLNKAATIEKLPKI